MESSQGNGSVPSGIIVAWSGSITTIPDGFALCNGLNGTPDLRNRFVIGAGEDSGSGYTSDTTEYGIGYFRPSDHGGQGKHLLTIAEMPSHSHVSNGLKNSTGVYFDVDHSSGEKGYYVNTSSTTSSYTGGSQSHNILPPYYALAYIMKI